jgi:Apea-like HEPN
MDAVYKSFDSLIRSALRDVGPKQLFPNPDKALPFEDDIMHSERYFIAGHVLPQIVTGNLPGLRGKLNDNTGYAIFDYVCHQLYQQIKARTAITQNLDKYLTDDDVKSTFELLQTVLTKCHDTYKVVLVTDLLKLREIISTWIGDVLLRRFDTEYIADWPDSCGTEKGKGLTFFINPSNYSSREEFLDKNKDCSVLEVQLDGYHFDDEQSLIFDSAVAAFKRVFSYLAICEFFFSNGRAGKYKIETTRLPQNSFLTLGRLAGKQNYYVLKAEDPKFIRAIRQWEQVSLSHRAFNFTSELNEQLRTHCFSDKVSELFKSKRSSEIKNKLARCFDWYLKAELESDLTDAALSLFISLEALLSPGGDPSMSHTDDMAENVAIMAQSSMDERYKWKKEFKRRYSLRNRIAHHGVVLDDRMEHWPMVVDLRADVVWAVIGILSRLDEILKYGNDSAAIREYFEREKLK